MSTFAEKIHTGDAGKTSDVSLYLFELTIDGQRYGGHIPARNWETAAAHVSKFGASIYGRSECFMPEGQLCSVCAGDMVIDTSRPKPLSSDDWPDEI